MNDNFPSFVQIKDLYGSVVGNDTYVLYMCRLKNSEPDRSLRFLLLQFPFEKSDVSVDVQTVCHTFVSDVTAAYETACRVV